jgi:hypothetical protein
MSAAFTESELNWIKSVRLADIRVVEGHLTIHFHASDEYVAKQLHNMLDALRLPPSTTPCNLD